MSFLSKAATFRHHPQCHGCQDEARSDAPPREYSRDDLRQIHRQEVRQIRGQVKTSRNPKVARPKIRISQQNRTQENARNVHRIGMHRGKEQRDPEDGSRRAPSPPIGHPLDRPPEKAFLAQRRQHGQYQNPILPRLRYAQWRLRGHSGPPEAGQRPLRTVRRKAARPTDGIALAAPVAGQEPLRRCPRGLCPTAVGTRPRPPFPWKGARRGHPVHRTAGR